MGNKACHFGVMFRGEDSLCVCVWVWGGCSCWGETPYLGETPGIPFGHFGGLPVLKTKLGFARVSGSLEPIVPCDFVRSLLSTSHTAGQVT